jgi:thiol-disulfide isomerase/thioredoxin
MSGLLFPGNEDFYIARGASGPILCTKINGFSLVLFYSTQCVYCKKLIPIFRKLPSLIGGCNFAMVNVAQARQVLQQSKNTIAPIDYVPYILFYVNNKPYIRYSGPSEMKEIKEFVIEVANNVQNKQTFSPEKVREPEREIPDYTIGQPLCGDGERCYLEFDDAYQAEPPGTASPSARKHISVKSHYQEFDHAYHSENVSDPNKQRREEYNQEKMRERQYQQQMQQRQYPTKQQQPQQQLGRTQYQHPQKTNFIAPHGRSSRQPQYGKSGY